MRGHEAHITVNGGQGRIKFSLTGIIVSILTALLLLIFPLAGIRAQTGEPRIAEPVQEVSEEVDIHQPSPSKAAMLSATMPGMGQIYNRKYWKVPIIYAGFGAIAYSVDFNNREYRMWREAWIARVDGNPNTTDDFPNHSTDWMERAMNYYRRNLEITYLLAGALYLLNILDASVDAHLMNFDIGEDLSLGLEPVSRPSISNPGFTTHSAQLSLKIRF